MSEQSMRQAVVELLRDLDALSVENAVNPGTPDVNYAEGWIELKERERWPAYESPVLIEHFTPQQRIFLRRRWAAGGHAYLLFKIGQEWLLFDGHTAHGQVGFVGRQELTRLALRHWKKRPTSEELRSCLTAKPRLKSKS